MAITTAPSRYLSRQAGTAADRWALRRIQHAVASARVRLMLWDGFQLEPSLRPAVATVTFRTRRALIATLWNPDLSLGDAYTSGEVEIRGDLLSLLIDIYRAMGRRTPVRRWLDAASNSVEAARDHVHRHYDIGNEFYKLWLDSEMVYTCAYFPTPDTALGIAQVFKMDRLCRKLALKPGERVVEAGCGWGALALFMARRYGVHVRAYNVSGEQVRFARERARQEGLSERVEFVEDDYRHIRGEYDAFVSVGMLEHVGRPNYGALGRAIARCLTEQGRGLLHFIGRSQPGELNPWIRARIFPGVHVPTLPEVITGVLEPSDFAMLDVENIRLHYAATLDHWRQRFEAAAGEVRAMFDEPFVRAWRLYLAGSQAAFSTGSMHLFQVVFARGSNNAIPWTRNT